MRAIALCVALAATGTCAHAAIDLDALWNFADPAASEARMRSALERATGDDALVLRTQIARTLGLRGRFEEAQRELDAIEAPVGGAGTEPRVRFRLEQGRVLRSSGRAAESKPWFERAYAAADAARLERLAADALHMLALAEPRLEDRIEWNRRTIAYAQRASDPRAQGWQAAALNNIGSDLREAARLDESLAAFREALAAYERIGRAGPIRIARWQIANVLRLQGKTDAALAMQLAIEQEAAAANEPDAAVHDELALLHEARGDAEPAARARARAQALRR